MQRELRVITLQGAIEKSPLLLSQYWKTGWLDGTIIISYFGGSNNIFADCKSCIMYSCLGGVSGLFAALELLIAGFTNITGTIFPK